MSQSAYIRAISFFTLLEAVLVAGGVLASYNWEPSLMLILGSFIGAVVCIMMFTMSDDPLLSGIGVGGMSLLLGLMMGPVVALYDSQAVMLAVVTTAGAMALMSVVGLAAPDLFRGWGPYVIAGLTLLIVIQFAQLFLVAMGIDAAANMPWVTWAGVILFLGIVAFDWSRALDMPYTLDNAIDASGGLILDAVNLFIRFLQLYANKGSSKD